jgi:hypothetical protein
MLPRGEPRPYAFLWASARLKGFAVSRLMVQSSMVSLVLWFLLCRGVPRLYVFL